MYLITKATGILSRMVLGRYQVVAMCHFSYNRVA